MRHRILVLMAILSASIPAAGQTPKPAVTTSKTATAAKPWTPPKTQWGDPDLQGTYTSDDYIGLGLQRNPQLGDKLYFTDQEIAQRETQIKNQATADLQETPNPDGRIGTGPPSHWGERARRSPRQTSLIVDPPNGRLPEMTPEAQSRPILIGANENDPKADSWEAFTYYIRCITRGVAGSVLPVPYGNGTQIVQAPGYVTILHEMVHEARVIPLNNTPRSNIRTYMGQSRGHWEGNTLVVETTNFLPGTTGLGGNGGGTPLSDALRLKERFTRISADTINYELNVVDEKTYLKPIKIAFPIRQEPGYQLFEYACHEGNYGMFNMLSAARAAEKK
jgi:hypothetical protein